MGVHGLINEVHVIAVISLTRQSSAETSTLSLPQPRFDCIGQQESLSIRVNSVDKTSNMCYIGTVTLRAMGKQSVAPLSACEARRDGLETIYTTDPQVKPVLWMHALEDSTSATGKRVNEWWKGGQNDQCNQPNGHKLITRPKRGSNYLKDAPRRIVQFCTHAKRPMYWIFPLNNEGV